MFSYRSRQVLHIHGTPQEIIFLEIARKHFVVVIYDVFLYVLESSSNYESPTGQDAKKAISSDWQVKRVWRLTSGIVKALKCLDLELLIILAKDGSLWKLAFSEISRSDSHDQSAHHCEAKESTGDSEIFATLLGNAASGKSKHPVHQVRNLSPLRFQENYKVICDLEIHDMFCIGKKLILVKHCTNNSHIFHKLELENDCIISKPLLKMEYLQKHSADLQKEQDSTMYFGLICQDKPPHSNSGLTLRKSLFLSTFPICSSLSIPFVILCADACGKISFFPLNVHADTDAEVDNKTNLLQFCSKANIFFDMRHQVLDTLQIDIGEINVKEDWDLQKVKDGRSFTESHISTMKKKLKEECAFLIIAKSGKVMIILQPDKILNLLPFNPSCVPGPVLSVSSVADFLVHATGADVHVSTLSLDVVIKRDMNASVVPNLKPVFTISSLTAVCLSRSILFLKESNVLSLCFMASNRNGHLCSILLTKTLEENTPVVLKAAGKERIKSLLRRLEAEQKILKDWEKLLQMQNGVLCLVQKASFITTSLMNCHKVFESCFKMALACNVKDVLLTSDDILFLDVELQSNFDHLIPEYFHLLCSATGREVPCNTQCGGLKVITRSFRIPGLASKSRVSFKWSLDLYKAKTVLPLKLEFKLGYPCSNIKNTRNNQFQEQNESWTFLPMHVGCINIFDVSDAGRKETVQNTLLLPSEIFSKNGSQVKCRCRSLYASICQLNTGSEFHDSRLASVKQLKKMMFPMISVPYLLSNKNRMTSNTEDSWFNFIQDLFPKQFLQDPISKDGCIATMQPCRHLIKCYSTTKGGQLTESPNIFLEGLESGLLIQSHSMLTSSLEKWIHGDLPVSIQMETLAVLKHLSDLQASLHGACSDKVDFFHAGQMFQRMLQLFFKCRSFEFI